MFKFKIGDVCILLDDIHAKHLIGTELTITGNLQIFRGVDGLFYEGYPTDLIDPVDGIEVWPQEHCLKKKPLKGEEDIMKLFTNLNNSDKIKTDKLIEEEVV